ncbi:MAG: RNA pseudouridine synthase [Clostridia bacterium]|nr:RNA pseudouridine synthase [Clostridia bacterium]
MIKIPVIFEDNHLLVVIKPPNILSQGDSSGDPDMLTILKKELKVRYNKPNNVYLGLIHRLDRPVGGVMVFAKTSKCASRLSEQIRNRRFKKTYLAVVHGKPAKEKATLIHYLLKDNKTNQVKIAGQNTQGAKEAVLDYEVMGATNGLSLVKINLHTGRSHQIRVQFASIGHPIYGDQRYGSNLNKPKLQIALWAYEIQCEHPTLKKKMSFTSWPGQDEPWNKFAKLSF